MKTLYSCFLENVTVVPKKQLSKIDQQVNLIKRIINTNDYGLDQGKLIFSITTRFFEQQFKKILSLKIVL